MANLKYISSFIFFGPIQIDCDFLAKKKQFSFYEDLHSAAYCDLN